VKVTEYKQDITLDLSRISSLGLTINEYLILYNVANNNEIFQIFNYTLEEVVALEAKGFIKILPEGIVLRARSNKLFSITSDDLFKKWLGTYPVKVSNGRGGTRAISPKDESTIVGKTLKKKWNTLFKKDIKAQEKAILVLELEIAEKTRSGEMQYMVEATKWLNQGYFEKYDYLAEDYKERQTYQDEDNY
jgi:hypothetical protein